MSKQYKVYMHIAPNGKKYIGITGQDSLCKRWDNGRGYHSNSHFQSAIEKYGWSNIQHILLYENLTKEEAENIEILLIAQHKSNDRRYGYNIEKGGSLNKEVSQETREKLRLNATGKRASAETKQKMSQSHKGSNCYWYGKHLSEEHREKISLKQSKKVGKYDEKGNLLKAYDSMNAAALEYGVTRQYIYASCIGKRKKACGFIWRYI